MSPVPPLQIALDIEAGDWPEGLDSIAETAIRQAFALSRAKLAGAAEVSILLTDDAHQRVLNRDWRQIDKSTNVLSFPQLEPFVPLSGLVGDISLARETVEREATDLGKTFEHHFTHLIVHGFLHLLGYDHENEADATEMEGLETRILAKLGIADPYADD